MTAEKWASIVDRIQGRCAKTRYMFGMFPRSAILRSKASRAAPETFDRPSREIRDMGKNYQVSASEWAPPGSRGLER